MRHKEGIALKTLRANLGFIILCLVELTIGVILLIDPDRFTRLVLFILGAVLLIVGVVCVIIYFVSHAERAAAEKKLAIGLLCVVAGSLFVFRNSLFPSLTLIYGIALLVAGAFKFQQGIDRLRFHIRYWYLTVLNAVIALGIGVLILVDPFKAREMLWRVVAFGLIVEAVLDLAAVITGFRAASESKCPPADQAPELSAPVQNDAFADDTDFQPIPGGVQEDPGPAPDTPEDGAPSDPGANQ